MALNFCPQCGTPIDAHERFCSGCGYNVRPATGPAPVPQAKRNTSEAKAEGKSASQAARPAKKRSSAKIVLGLITVAVLAVGGAAFFATMEKTITLSDYSLTLYSGDTKTLSVTVGKVDTDFIPLKWSSSNTDVATVADDGTVTAVGAGKAVIYVSAEGYAAKKCSLTVNPNVYVAGTDNDQATLWVNGVSHRLSDRKTNSRANSVHASQNDVFVAGYDWTEGGLGNALLWKFDGKKSTAVRLKDNSIDRRFVAMIAKSVFVSENNIYMTGYIGVPHSEEMYDAFWKYNGAITTNKGFKTVLRNVHFSSCYVANNTVFVVGGEYFRNQEFNKVSTSYAVLIENGTPKRLTDGKFHASANSVYVSNTDVYVVGYEENAKGYAVATLWKNGTAKRLSDGTTNASATSVFVSVDNDVYVVGKTYDYGEKDEDEDFIPLEDKVAMLWKNGIPTPLTDGKLPSSAESVYVVNKDVYIAGCEGESAVLWKNGQKTVLGKGEANSVFVK